MADSMCGPSNALQSFQKQSTVDRTLQQDRLTSRPPPSQGFRSAGPSAGPLDSEFEAFQAGQLPPQHPEAQGFYTGGFQAPHLPQHLPQAGPEAWANDLQRMTISQAPGSQRHGLPQTQHTQHGGGWHQEFIQMQSQQAMSQTHHNYSTPVERLSSIAATPFRMQQQSMYPTPMFSQPGPSFHTAPQSHTEPQAQTDAFDEEAFARAFDQAAQSELQDPQQAEQAALSHALQNPTSADPSTIPSLPIGADAIHHPDDPSYLPLTPAQESDDLAKTAGQLLNSVRDDHSDKFQNSVFLALMRQLRDKEVVVEGDAIKPAREGGGGGGDNTLSGEGAVIADTSIRSRGREPGSLMPMDESDGLATTTTTGTITTGGGELPTVETSEGEQLPHSPGGLGGIRGIVERMKEVKERERIAGEALRREALDMLEEELMRDGKWWGDS